MMAHFVLAQDQSYFGFTVNIGRDAEKFIEAKGDKAKGEVSKRLRKALKPILGDLLSFWFCLEKQAGAEPYLHFHGEMACLRHQIPAIKAALTKAFGNWGAGKLGSARRAVDFEEAAPTDLGWVRYAFKSGPSKRRRKSTLGSARTWRDDRFEMSLRLKQRAELLYNEVQPMVKIDCRGICKAARLH